MFFLGVDIGGTFTDLVLVDERGENRVYKTPTCPDNPAKGVLEAVVLAAADLGLNTSEFLSRVVHFGHGTTLPLNTLLEGKGARVGLITTRGFGDTLFIGRLKTMTAALPVEEITHYRSRSFPKPLVPRELVREVSERIDNRGEVVVPLNLAEARRAAADLGAQGVEAIAVCFLWSFLNPRHERAMGEILKEVATGVLCCLSCDLIPVIKEYERMATTVVNACLTPRTRVYLSSLREALQSQGLRSPLLILNSGGGMLTDEEAARDPVRLLGSGPAGGVGAALYLGKALGLSNLVTTDMGGTSFDVGLICDGEAVKTVETVAGKYHLLIPQIDLRSIGAGGGSLATVVDGVLKVGPRSAGADPGPACYGRGGQEPTVTDADVVLGILNPENFLGGRLRLDAAAAQRVIREKVADPLGIPVSRAAAGIRTIVGHQMADLLRQVLVERGCDPREFTVLAFGGAGPVHCTTYAAELEVRSTVIPPAATAYSAYGCAAADLRYVFERSEILRTPPFFKRAADHLEADRLEKIFSALEMQGAEALERSGIESGRRAFLRTAHMRYRRQTHEVVVPAPPGPLSAEQVDLLCQRFEEIYQRRYGRGSAYREAGIEITTLRVEAVGNLPKPNLREFPLEGPDPSHALRGKRPIYFLEAGDFLETPVYSGPDLRAGNEVVGPAVIESFGTTVVVGVKQKARLDSLLNVVLERGTGRD